MMRFQSLVSWKPSFAPAEFHRGTVDAAVFLPHPGPFHPVSERERELSEVRELIKLSGYFLVQWQVLVCFGHSLYGFQVLNLVPGTRLFSTSEARDSADIRVIIRVTRWDRPG
jgi:hypothetical protein